MSHTPTGYVISDSIHAAWDLFKKKWLTVYGLYALPMAIGIAYTLIVGPMGEDFSPVALLSMAVYFVIQMMVSMGVTKGYLNLSRGKDVSLDTFTKVLPLTGKYLLGMILFILIVMGGTLLFILPGVYFSFKYYFAPFLIIDKGLGPIEALKESAKLTDGIKWELVGLVGATVALAYLGLFALLVGIFVTAPVAGLSYFFFYNHALKRLEK